MLYNYKIVPVGGNQGVFVVFAVSAIPQKQQKHPDFLAWVSSHDIRNKFQSNGWGKNQHAS
jgi:accessory colonization factor AcfC